MNHQLLRKIEDTMLIITYLIFYDFVFTLRSERKIKLQLLVVITQGTIYFCILKISSQIYFIGGIERFLRRPSLEEIYP